MPNSKRDSIEAIFDPSPLYECTNKKYLLSFEKHKYLFPEEKFKNPDLEG